MTNDLEKLHVLQIKIMYYSRSFKVFKVHVPGYKQGRVLYSCKSKSTLPRVKAKS